MKQQTNRLYLRISLILLVLLGVLGVIYLQITGYTAQRYLAEINQRLYGDLATYTVKEVKPLVGGQVDTTAIQKIMHSMMTINPSVEVYLLNDVGNIITYVAPYKKVVLEKVDLGPVREFIRGSEEAIVLGDDPRHPGQQKVFSASKIEEEGNIQGYVYIILASEEQAAVTNLLFGSYFLKLGTNVFFISLLGALGIGLLAIWILTRNLRTVIATVSRFKEGDLEARIPKGKSQDLYPLGETFNSMADTILANIEQLKSVENLRRELIANVSHDLRTPLAIMQGYVETLLIKEDSIGEAERRHYLGIVLDSSEKLKRLIEQLFEFAKLEAAQIEPKKESFFISDLAQDVFHKYQILAQDKGIHIELDMPQSLPLVFADVALVERVLQNLLDNALKFTPSDGEVRIELWEEGESVGVRIADSGPGIPEQDQAFIFERYHRSNRTAETKNKGAGLGLAIVKKILELHDETIRVQSKLNEGTTFVFQLPAYGA